MINREREGRAVTSGILTVSDISAAPVASVAPVTSAVSGTSAISGTLAAPVTSAVIAGTAGEEGEPQPILEVCVDSAASARAAVAGGADRLELCANLSIGGTTPSLSLFRRLRAECSLPIHVLIRPRGGDFLYDEDELAEMEADIRAFVEAGADGLVCGCLTAEGELDAVQLARFRSCAGERTLTLHRAFDLCRDAQAAVETAIELGADIILSSGQAADCAQGLALLRDCQRQANGRIVMLAGGGVNADNIGLLYQAGLRQFHLSGKRHYESAMRFRREGVPMGAPGLSEYERWQTDASLVRAAREALKRVL